MAWFFYENGSPSSTANVSTIDEQGDKNVSKSVQYFASEFADVILRVAKRGDGRMLLQLVKLLPDTSFKINILIGTSKAYHTVKCHH